MLISDICYFVVNNEEAVVESLVKAHVVPCVRYRYCDVRDILYSPSRVDCGGNGLSKSKDTLSGEEPDRRLSTCRRHFLKGIMRLKKGRGRSSTGKQ